MVMFDVAPPSYGSDRQCKMNQYISARGKIFSPNFPFPPCLQWSCSPLAVALTITAALPHSQPQIRFAAPFVGSPTSSTVHRSHFPLANALPFRPLSSINLVLSTVRQLSTTPLHHWLAPHTSLHRWPATVEPAICFCWPSNSISLAVVFCTSEVNNLWIGPGPL